ncbi:MAG TPA: VWA domain-containing protein [Kofleriaceae bacterium]|nr:VWA domain-containing protein [Kofleriaceae bacterium]
MSFAHPMWLWLIVPALALAAIDVARRWNASRGRRALAIATRTLLVAALVAAAAEPRWSGERSDATVVFLIDRSASIDDAALAHAWSRAADLRNGLGADQRAAVVQFDANAEVAIAPGDPWVQPTVLRGPAGTRDATDIAGAIRLGLGLIPPGTGGHLVLIGDGRGNAGDLAAATALAHARGVPVSVEPTAAVSDDPAVAAIVLDSDRVHTGSTLTGHVDVDSGGVVGKGKVTMRVAGVDVETVDVDLNGGHVNVPFTYPLPEAVKPGVISIDASLAVASGADRDPSNDKAESRLVVERPPHILILDGDEGGATALAATLRAEQMDVTVVPAAGDGSPPDLSNVDLVILANAPVHAGIATGLIDDEFGEKLVRWVNDGGGLVVLGGPSALDGNYAANRLADALPIEIEPMTPELDSSATVIVVLDESGSMGAMVGDQTKLALACEGTEAVIRLLRSFDRVGVEAVEDRVHWTIPVRMIGGDTAALEQKVRDIQVGGDGIFIYTGLIAAQEAMEKATTPLKHVIVFSDTTDAAEQVKGIDYGNFTGWPSSQPNSLQVAKEMHEKGITVSVIGVGEGADNGFNYSTYVDDEDDTDFLRELARVGGGRYYRTTDAKQLRGLFVQDARKLIDTHAREMDVMLKQTAHYAALDGVDLEHAPPLHGFQEVKPRPSAQVVLTEAKEGNPILTRWPYGLGESIVWASDAGPRWADAWLKWSGYSRFWSQLARTALRRREGDASAIEADVTGDGATVRVVRRSERASVAAPHARLVSSTGATSDLPLHVVEPGVYEAHVDVASGREPTVELVDDSTGAITGRRTIVRPPSAELRLRGADLAALTDLAKSTGGAVSPSRISAAGRDTATTTPLAAWCLLLAVLLLPADAALRRIARDPAR